jgi:hypothetical protein
MLLQTTEADMHTFKPAGQSALSGRDVEYVLEDDEGRRIRATVTRGALDDLAPRGAAQIDAMSVYRHWEGQLDAIAIDKFLTGDHNGGVVIVNAQDAHKAGLPSD